MKHRTALVLGLAALALPACFTKTEPSGAPARETAPPDTMPRDTTPGESGPREPLPSAAPAEPPPATRLPPPPAENQAVPPAADLAPSKPKPEALPRKAAPAPARSEGAGAPSAEESKRGLDRDDTAARAGALLQQLRATPSFPTADCPAAREQRATICALADRICRLVERDPNVASIADYCTEARQRCVDAGRRTAERCG